MTGKNRPIISVIIPVYHEAARINKLLAHLHAIDDDGVSERIVVDGSSEADTIRGIDDPSVITVRSSKGRARQMNAGADAASGDILLFLHADTTLPPGAFQTIDDVLEDRTVVGGAFRIRFEPERFVFKVFGVIDSWRSRLTRVPYGDQAIFVRRDYFDQNNRFSDIPLMEDIELMRRIKRRGDRIHILDAAVTSSARRWEREGLFYCTARNCVLVGLFWLGVSPHKLKRFYPDDPGERNCV
jgi:rSAM/selenodomain-associated transferase 2